MRHLISASRGLSLLAASAIIAVGCASDPSEESGSDSLAAVCSGATQWQQGQSYRTGDVVSYNGALYIAEHENPGYDPTISTWFWDPYSGSCGGETPGGDTPGNCSGVAQWQAGKSYRTGDIVSYNGAFYITEHENPGYDPTVSTWFWDPYSGSCGGETPGGETPGGETPGGEAGTGLGGLVSSSMFNSVFPNRIDFYTLDALLKAGSAYPEFANSSDMTIRKREVAAFLANVNHESDQLRAVREYNTSNYCHYCDPNQSYGCPAGACSYFGRGPIQLSWNYNYKALGDIFGVDLLNNPDLVATDPAIAWRTAVHYWMTNNGPNTITSHTGITCTDGSCGFGQTIRSINGSLECDGRNPGAVESRVSKYKQICDLLGVSYGNNLGC